jgi:hypothetical protein
MIFLSDKELSQFCPEADYSKFIRSTIHIRKTLTSTEVGMKLYRRHTCTQFCSKRNINVSSMCADRCLKKLLQRKFRNSVELARVMGETLNISVKTKYHSSIGDLISKGQMM